MMRKHQWLFFLILAVALLGVAAFNMPNPDIVEAPGSDPTQDEVDQCLVCHTDKDALVSSAKVEEAVASENEGEG